jgi:CRISPR/Cas system Type II protein with McrA/HNH and RuvC-like nuclease domain
MKLFSNFDKTEELIDLFNNQNKKCWYSQEILIPGKNTGLDHQIPCSRGGLDELPNFRWVTIQVNRIKQDMTHDEFVKFCQGVALRFG